MEKVRIIVSLLIIICITVFWIIIRFKNPDMTELRLVIDFWQYWIATIALAILAMYLLNKK